MPDDRLPSHGPGRNGNGNLHLTEITVSAAPASAPEGWRPVPIARAAADFDQAGWGIAGAIDGDPKTAWGIYPEVGKPHEGIFEFREEVGGRGRHLAPVRAPADLPGRPPDRPVPAVGHRRRPPRAGGLAPRAARRAPGDPARSPDARAASGTRGDLPGRDPGPSDSPRLPPPRLVYAAASDFAPDGSHKPTPGPRPVFVLKRGDIRQPGAAAVPGALGCVGGLEARVRPADEGGRRAPSSPAGCPIPGTRSPGDRSSIGPGTRTSAGGWSTRRTTSAGWAARRATPSCSTGWRRRSARTAARSNGCIG